MPIQRSPPPPPVSDAVERQNCDSTSRDEIGSPHPFSCVPAPDPDTNRISAGALAALHKEQLRASAIIDCLRRAHRDGGVHLDLTVPTVIFEWACVNDALFVFEAITGRQNL